MMWVLIVSELLVFGAGMAAFLGVRITDPAGFADAQTILDRTGAGINTVVLLTSGLLAALAVRCVLAERLAHARMALLSAAALGVVFLVVKVHGYAAIAGLGISTETHPFYAFYYLLTGFHAAHVAAGVLILAALAWRPRALAVEVGALFWHMVDLVWLLLFPVFYLL